MPSAFHAALGPAKVLAEKAVDALFALRPEPPPSPERWAKIRLVAHRGAHGLQPAHPADPHAGFLRENSVEAFSRAASLGLWGLEFDIRFTRDDIPVICHDPDLKRVFGLPLRVGEESFSALKKAAPSLPGLEELLRDQGGRLHFMAEVKEPLDAKRRDRLRGLFSSLQAGEDYHFLSLDPSLLETVSFLPREACLLVAETNTAAMSRAALASGYGGLLGHFLLLDAGTLRRHHQAGQKVGTGFIASRACLYRELNRGVDFLFTNRAAALQEILRGPLGSK